MRAEGRLIVKSKYSKIFRCAAAVNEDNDHMLEITAEKQKEKGSSPPHHSIPLPLFSIIKKKRKRLSVNNSFFCNVRVTQTFCSILSQTWNTDIDSSTLYYGNLWVELRRGWQVRRMDSPGAAFPLYNI